jgi:hypothetical protein
MFVLKKTGSVGFPRGLNTVIPEHPAFGEGINLLRNQFSNEKDKNSPRIGNIRDIISNALILI